MGSCFSVSLSLDQVVNNALGSFWVNVNYLRNLEENIKGLKDATEELKAEHIDLSRRIAEDERFGAKIRLVQVQRWLLKAEDLEARVNAQLGDSIYQIQRLCLCGFCSKKLVTDYRYGKGVFKLRKEVDDHRSKAIFDVVSSEAPQPKVEMRPIEPTVGQEDMLDRTWRRIIEDEIGILGLHGMGGVGKTTLLTRINNMLKDKGENFDIVIWVVVSKDMQLEKIQDEIGEKLGFSNDTWILRRETTNKANDIYNTLRTKKFVLFLDDVWEKIDLTKIGIPFPDTQNKCKVVFTTRSREVCGQMRVHAAVEVKCLRDNEAWDLFQKVVGNETLGRDSEIHGLAKSIVSKCKGLPLALKVVGETMASKTMVEEWHHAVDVLTLSTSKFSGMKDDILPILKFSYDSLKDDKIKECFKYCALFPEDHLIKHDLLVDHWISNGIIEETDDIRRGANEGHEIIGTLVRASLLIESSTLGFMTIVEKVRKVKMHDIVREMALWMTSDCENQRENFFVKAGARLHEMPQVEKWQDVKRMSLVHNNIKMISDTNPDCHQLETLLLMNNKLRNISGEFFLLMRRLYALDLSDNRELLQLPEEISELANLRYLNLSLTGIKRLPIGLQKLKMLMHLNLEWTFSLESISGISCLSSLRILRLQSSKAKVDVQVLEELQLLDHLEVLGIDIETTSLLQQFLCDERLTRCSTYLGINDVKEESSLISSVADMHNLTYLRVRDSFVPKLMIDWRDKVRVQCFSNLRTLDLYNCNGMRDATWLQFASNLEDLSIVVCNEIEEVISKEKISNNLPDLKRIVWTPLSFPCLLHLGITSCPKLTKLPLHSKSVPAVDDNIFVTTIPEKEWVEELEWEDTATRQRFLHLFNE